MSNITREEAIILLDEIRKILLKNASWDESTHEPINQTFDMAIEALENQKTGHWVEIDDYPHEDFECDCCGGQVYGTENPYEEYKYCSNCGAKMEGDTNDTL